MLCLAVVLSTLAFGTVHSWSLAFFQAGAVAVVVLWATDTFRARVLRLSRNALQWPLLGLIALGLVQLLPFGAGVEAGALAVEPVRSLTLDPYATRLIVIHVAALLIYFAAALAFIDSPRRFRLIVRTLIIFGFLLALFSMMQHFLNPRQIYWLREPDQAEPFGPFINRHHFAGYMELMVALPLGLLLAGAVPRDRMLLYGFAAAMMGFSLILTNSRGGIISLVALVFFLVAISSVGWRRRGREEASATRGGRARAAMTRAGIALAILVTLFGGVLFFGGEESLTRLIGSVNTNDPTTGRLHFWRGTWEIIKDYPLLGAGLGSFSVAYPRYDTANGYFRLEQAHNDYLQVLADAGILGAALGLIFLVALFRQGFARLNSTDKFRRGVALGALGGCFAVLTHSFFDFTLHTTSNSLLFLVLAALATINGRVEQPDTEHRRRRKRRRHTQQGNAQAQAAAAPPTPQQEQSATVAAGTSGEQL